MAHVKLESVSKSFKGHHALADLSLEIEDGKFFVLLGPTGAGKTTTLRLIAGLEKADQGTISIDRQDVSGWGAAERDVALVLQQYSLYPRYTVRQNLEFPLKSRLRRLPEQDIAARVARAAKIVRIEHLLDRKTDRLSGGEMQRVSIGRAIVRQPKIFLMDEPLSNLDAKLRESLRAELKDLKATLGATFLFVTHDQVEAMSMGDRIAVLNEGRLAQVGSPKEIYGDPKNVFVAGFVGSPAMNLVPTTFADGKAIVAPGQLEIPLQGNIAERLRGAGAAATLGIRAEDIALGDGAPFAAVVHHVEHHGVEQIVTLRVADKLLRVAVPANRPLAIDQPVRFAWALDKVHAFDPTSGERLSFSARAAGA
jgi:multiple sugar transport system ATP-binding protein